MKGIPNEYFRRYGSNSMKKEIDFSKGERGKFYRPDAEFKVPIYLDPEIAHFMERIAVEKNIDINEIVNDFLRRNIALIQSIDQKVAR